jgi:hypothetical protein
MNYLHFYRLCWTMALMMLANANTAQCEEQDDKTAIVNKWKAYFRDIRSLSYRWNEEILVDNTGQKMAGRKTTSQFDLNGSRYRVELQPYKGSNVAYFIFAYNGKLYQDFVATAEGTQLSVRRKAPTGVYGGGGNVLCSYFRFIFPNQDLGNVADLQQDKFWQGFLKRIVAVRNATQEGRAGKMLTIKGSVKHETYEVFVENATAWPWSVSAKRRELDDSGKAVVLSYTGRTTKVHKWRGSRGLWLFPLSIDSVAYEDDVLFQKIKEWIDPNTLKINQPVKAEIFTLPRSQAKVYIDQDEMEEKVKRIREAEQKRKETLKNRKKQEDKAP